MTVILTIPEGPAKKLYIDRDHVKLHQHKARPWTVETATGCWRGTNVYVNSPTSGRFDLDQKPCIWLETRGAVYIEDAEAVG